MRQYIDLIQNIVGSGADKDDRTGVGTKSCFGYQMRFNMREGFPLLTLKKTHWKSIVHELLWFLSGDTNIKYLKDNKVRIWDEWADKNGDLGPVYGKQWVSWEPPAWNHNGTHINQIQNAIDKLKTNPDDRGIIVSAWNVGELDQMALRPCHTFFQFYSTKMSHEERADILQDDKE